MAILYTRYYTYTGQDNTKVSNKTTSVSFNSKTGGSFKISGDTTHDINQVVSITYQHYHTSTGSNPTWPLTGYLAWSGGGLSSDSVSVSFKSNVKKCLNTWKGSSLPTATQFNAVTSIRTTTTKNNTSSTSLYWRANSDYPMVIAVQFYDELPQTYFPTIDYFGVTRVNRASIADVKGDYAQVEFKLNKNSNASSSSQSLKVYWRRGGEVTLSDYTDSADLTSYISSGLTAQQTVSIPNKTFSIETYYSFLLVFTLNGEFGEAKAFFQTERPIVHLSDYGCVAIGDYAGEGGSGGSKYFDVHYETRLQGGLYQIGNGLYSGENEDGTGSGIIEDVLTCLGIQSGVVGTEEDSEGDPYRGITLPGSGSGGIVTGTVNFTIPFQNIPVVTISFRTNDKISAYQFGNCSCTVIDVTTTNFTYKLYNANSTKRLVALSWIAVGPTVYTYGP